MPVSERPHAERYRLGKIRFCLRIEAEHFQNEPQVFDAANRFRVTSPQDPSAHFQRFPKQRASFIELTVLHELQRRFIELGRCFKCELFFRGAINLSGRLIS